MFALLIATLAAAAGPDAAAPASVVAFPGQWAPSPPGSNHPVSPKSCLTRSTDPAERAACLEHVVKDWSRIDRFTEANAALGPPAKGERRVVFFGDSITDNWSKPEYGGFFPGRRYVNRGIGGQTTGQMLGRFRQDVIALGARVVVLLAGTNDLAGNAGPVTPEMIESNLANMAELARAHGIKVVLATLLPVCDCKQSPSGTHVVRTGDRPPEAIVALNRWIADYARKNGSVLLDYHRALAGSDGAFKSELTFDGLHPNQAGYTVMAPLAEKAIAAALR
jgi:lysophospholipase L1-like esterase